MRNIAEMEIIQIDVTNICDRTCANCTRLCGHHTADRSYFMDLEQYEQAVRTLRDFPGMVGMIGGEPTLHPQFPELCAILKSHIPDRERRGLWTNAGKKYHEHKKLIDDTFGFKNINDHLSHDIIHTPVLVASEDLVSQGLLSEQQWTEYTDSCWVQNTWSATVTPKGAYFCEVAAMLDLLFDGNTGWDVKAEPEWWRRTLPDYAAQISWACRKCGCQLPLYPRRSTDAVDDVSESNLKRLLSVNSPKILKGKYCIYSRGLDRRQLRNNTWYWNKRSYFATIIGKLSSLFRKG